MTKKVIKSSENNDEVNRIFDDLEAYRDFCRDAGYFFDEADLYKMKKYSFQQFNKFRNGKNYKDQWEFDRRRFARQ